jgi:TolB-like protein/Tfp pilus assembly protein PilF
MPDSPNKLSRFWQELKRRRVVHVITLYASATFVIIELINNLAEPFNLPPNLLTIVVIVLAVGFPLAIILSWLYDVTSEGVEKTRPIEELKEGEKTVVPNAWKIATFVSFVVILGLLTFNIIGGTKSLKAGDIQSLVVLPFDNYTGDDQLENMVSGMHALLVGDMGRISGVRVLGGTTSNAYKNAGMTATEIADELNVDAVVEASVMCFGDTVCMQFRLVQTTGKEEQLWIADYKEDMSQMLNLNNQITKQIADEIMIELTPEEELRLAKSRTVDREAYDAYVRSYQYWDDLSLEGLNKGLEYLNLAIEKDPDFAPLYAGLAQVWVGLAQMQFVAPEVAGPKIFEYLNKALELDPDFPDAHYNAAIIAVWQEWNWEKGEKEFLQAIAANPNDAMSRVYYSHLLWILKRYDEARFHSQMAAELDPMNPLVLTLSAGVGQHGDFQQALEICKKALEIEPEHHFVLLAYAELTYFNGDYKNSIETELKVWQGLDDDARDSIRTVFQVKGYVEAIKTLLSYAEEYAKTNYISYYEMGEYYYRVGNREKSIESYIKGYEMHDPMMPYFTIPIFGFDDIKDDPRIIAIVEKMNLPFEAPN